MRRSILALLMAGFLAAPHTVGYAEARKDTLGMKRYLSHEKGSAGWQMLGEPQTARGDDLYLLIDGAAEIFHEYGFDEAVIQSFRYGDGKTINLEVYEMADSAAAYGIYTFRTGEGGSEIDIGAEGRIEDYYLNFWKGCCLVTVVGFDTDEVTMDGVTSIATIVDGCIPGGGGRPRLVDALAEEGLKPNGIEYVRGNLALYNHYEFDRANIFGVSEGVIGTYADHTIFLFSYDDEEAGRRWFRNGVRRLKDNPDFHEYGRDDGAYVMRDRRGEHLRIEPYRSYVVIILGAEETAEILMEEQKELIDRL